MRWLLAPFRTRRKSFFYSVVWGCYLFIFSSSLLSLFCSLFGLNLIFFYFFSFVVFVLLSFVSTFFLIFVGIEYLNCSHDFFFLSNSFLLFSFAKYAFFEFPFSLLPPPSYILVCLHFITFSRLHIFFSSDFIFISA